LEALPTLLKSNAAIRGLMRGKSYAGMGHERRGIHEGLSSKLETFHSPHRWVAHELSLSL
jgi:hypothetical protein